MSATMSGDTPLRQIISTHCGLSQPTLENGVPCKHWGLRGAKNKEENISKKRKKPNKNRASGAVSSTRKSVIPGTPGRTERREGGDHTMTQLLTIEDAQHILAVSRTTVWRLIQSGELETIHIRRSIRIPSDALQAYIDNARSPRGVKL